MDDFDFVVSLLTPAGDLVPATAVNGQQNVDILVGDLFDNSPEEFEVIVGIQEDDPLIVLDRDIPSVRGNRFILGDGIQPYYTTFDPFSLG